LYCMSRRCGCMTHAVQFGLELRLGDGTTVPYLSFSLLADLIARSHPTYPYFVVKRAEQHFRAETSDRDLVRDIVWAWANRSAGWKKAVPWRRTDATEGD
jgi:hypothetical protein